MADVREWKDAELSVLAKLDIAAVYRDLGVIFTRDTPTGKGWLACHAVGRADGTASAAVNVGETPMRGRYRDMGGDGLSLNLWEFAARFGKFPDWRAARKHYADKVQASLPAGGEPKRPEDGIEFILNAASDLILQGWVDVKGGFDLQTIKDNGALYGRYPKKAKAELGQYVVCFPAYNPPDLTDGTPSAWVVANTTGESVVLYRGKGKEPTKSKTLSVGGSVGGLLGAAGLRALLAEREGSGPPVEVVWKVEGLTDLLTLYFALKGAGLLGKHVVISNSQGTLESVKPEWVELLKGKAVNVVHDRDRPGETGAGRWVHLLAAHSAAVREVRLPYKVKDSHGEDIRDFLWRDKRPVTELVALAEATPPHVARQVAPNPSMFSTPASAPAWAKTGNLFDNEPEAVVPQLGGDPPAAAGGLSSAGIKDPKSQQGKDAAAILDMIGVDVLGEYTAEGSVDVYSRECRKVVPIRAIKHFSYTELIQMCGDAAFLFVHEGKDRVDGKVTMNEVRQAIAFKARDVDLSRVGTLGQGIWRSGEHFVVVNGGTAALYDPKTNSLGRITNPRLGHNVIIDFSATEPWVDFAVLNDLLHQASDPAWAMQTLQSAAALFSNWNWKHPQDSWNTALLVAQTFIQTTLPWRPEVAVTGPSDCGKSTLMTTLTNMFGNLNMYVQKPTEAGLRQHLGNTAKAVLVDEFENDRHRQNILEVFRVTSQGGSVVRGTTDQRGKVFYIRHLPWFAAIESGLVKAADRNRFIILDLAAIPARKRGRVDLPGPVALGELGLKLCAVALRYADAASRIFKTLKGTQFDGVHGRVVESFSVPASLKAAIAGQTAEEATRTLGQLLADRTTIGTQGGGDEADLMKAILDSTFPVGSGLPPVSVAVAISDPETYLLHASTLESQGIAMTEGRPGQRRPTLEGKKFIFFDLDRVKRFLLRGTPWWSLDCQQLLMRLPGASRQQRTVGNQRPWGVEVPAIDWVVPVEPGERLESVMPLDIGPEEEPILPPDELDGRDGPVAAPTQAGGTNDAMKALMEIDLT